MLGIGGGGDVVGALAVGRLCERLGTPFSLGGVSWERFPIDPHPGPRTSEEIRGATALAPSALLAGPETTTPAGVPFSESRMASFLGAETVLIDITAGPGEVADGIIAAAARLDCDLAVYVDVGGDVLARGGERDLASPLCDAVMLAAAARADAAINSLGAVFGPGCDGELDPDEVTERILDLASVGALLGTWSLVPRVASELAEAATVVPTEASLQAVRCARGESGEVEIRGGRRRVELSPLGALTFFFDPIAAFEHAPLARAVSEAGGIEAARAALERLGVRTELDYERSRARQGP